ncbi:hypothetical protein [Goodfellowiella coeruleoviolacea]|uniref:Uncharacterized protein n=1 Tax=Goodfellowiella coeruleoviolacea TaxID=334858 RepID=A0AAE3GIN6_9PSEU|nr:hypothetical protein [Goodfellowiella coeruleoviolacea]MCP2168916.1 hypothetical protein [Goodfellowiella coeruleoviolacea]
MRSPDEAAEVAARNGFGAHVLTVVDGDQPAEGPRDMVRAMAWTVLLVAGVWLVVAADSAAPLVLGVLLLAVVVATLVRFLLRERRAFAQRTRLHCFQGGVVVRGSAHPWTRVSVAERWDTQLVGQDATPRQVLSLIVTAPGVRAEVRGGAARIQELVEQARASAPRAEDGDAGPRTDRPRA